MDNFASPLSSSAMGELELMARRIHNQHFPICSRDAFVSNLNMTLSAFEIQLSAATVAAEDRAVFLHLASLDEPSFSNLVNTLCIVFPSWTPLVSSRVYQLVSSSRIMARLVRLQGRLFPSSQPIPHESIAQ